MKEDKEILKIKRGYLKKDFEFFHIRDQKNMEFEFHYHDFNKIIVFISGKVTYLIEGKAYKLKPWDILLVGNNEIHKPLIDSGEAYERIVIWVNSGFLKKHSSDNCNLLSCFELAGHQKYNLLRAHAEKLLSIKSILSQLEDEFNNNDFGSGILRNALFTQLVVQLNRSFMGVDNCKDIEDIEYDESIGEVIKYINENLNEDLSVENLSSVLFMSKYYLMHKFKKQTGYTIHNYILQKRLALASSLIKRGKPVTEVYLESGFGDYSNFVRAFKKMYGLSPKKYYITMDELDRQYNKNIY